MQYLKNALQLKQLINEANQITLSINKAELKEKNLMFLDYESNEMESFPMESFTNEYVHERLKTAEMANCLLISDIAKMDVKGTVLHYFLYKAYHKNLEKGLVYYQLINSNTFEPEGQLQFSNLEENVFFKVSGPDFEESSCNAMETGEQSATQKNIAFLIGHTHEERLLYDIERLIYDTVNNIQKNPKVLFNFVIQVSVFGGEISNALKTKVEAINEFAQGELKELYPNINVSFDFE